MWLEAAVVSILMALGNVLLGHFEERTRGRELPAAGSPAATDVRR